MLQNTDKSKMLEMYQNIDMSCVFCRISTLADVERLQNVGNVVEY